MIEAEHAVVIDTGIDSVWDFVQDISKWALLFPGCKECEVIDDHHSRWMIKVGVGGLVKTVNVLVHVEQWDGPERVTFNYKLESEPVSGSGSYTAKGQGHNATEINLLVKVEGSGQMAPMWEAMCKPLLPQMAKVFSGKLKAQIEGINVVEAMTEKASLLSTVGRWLRKLWQGIVGASASSKSL
jgi:carbon monoxide dehydrogenase subunit G